MKRSRVIIFMLVLTALIVSFAACDLSDFFRSTIIDYEFSEDGFEEMTKFYIGFYEHDTDYSITWVSVDSENVETTIKWSRTKTEDNTKYSILLNNSEKNLRILAINEQEKNFIDENNKTCFSYSTSEFDFVEKMINLCTLQLTEEEGVPLWEFLEKITDVNIEDYEGVEYETVQYKYIGVGENNKLAINFDKKSFLGIYPVIRKIEYQFDSDKVDIYLKVLPNTSLEAEDFNIPTEELGYTIIN